MSNAIEQAYELGWRRSAEWSKRDDLLSDIGSPAYKRERDEDLAHLSAQAKVRAPNSGLPTELRLVCGHDSRSVDGCINCEAADALESFAARQPQGARGEAQPFIWFATDDNGSYGIGADRNSAISDLPFMARRVFPLYTHPAERAAVPDDFDGERYCDMVDAYDEAISKGWNREQAMGCAIRAYYAALEDFAARLSQGAQGDGSYVHVVPDKCDRVVWHNQYIHLTDRQRLQAERAAVPDEVRVALDECRADLGYLFGRVAADGSFCQAAADSIRLKLDKVARFHATFTAAPQPPEGARVVDDRKLLRAIVDEAWQEATESEQVPSTVWADKIIDRVLAAPTLAGKEGAK